MDVFAGKKESFEVSCMTHNWLIIYLLSSLHQFSWELASVLKDSMPRFDSAGVKLIAVGVGTPDRARILAERVMILLVLYFFF